MDDVKRWSVKLLIISGVITIFVLAFILSRISPETRGVKMLESGLTASRILNHVGSANSGLDPVQEVSSAAADEQFLKAMQCANGDNLVTQGRK